MTNVALLKEKIHASGLKMTFIAESMGVSRAALYAKINGITPFNQYEIDALCEVLGIKIGSEMKRIFFDRDVDKNDNINRSQA